MTLSCEVLFSVAKTSTADRDDIVPLGKNQIRSGVIINAMWWLISQWKFEQDKINHFINSITSVHTIGKL